MAHDAGARSAQSILYQSEDHSVVLIDVPGSIEEAQVLPAKDSAKSSSLKRLVSSKPPDEPFKTPEPKGGPSGGLTDSVSDLMSAAAASNALEILRRSYQGPWCLPRMTRSATEVDGESSKRKRTASPPEDPVDEARSSTERKRSKEGDVFIPEDSFYLHGTISHERDRFLREAPRFDLIVLDPPWPNRSARRKKNSYHVADSLDDIRQTLSLVPIEAHLAPDGLVAVWITNKASVIELLAGPRGLLTEWGLELVDEWTWLKITTDGEPMVNIDSAWRKPWERIVIARVRGSERKPPCRGRVIVSVPDLHSRKPSLRALFDDVLPSGYQGLEVFARNLTAGWWSWGDEALRFQRPEHWVDAQPTRPPPEEAV